MMQPKKTKFRKAHKGRIHGLATSGATLSFGQYGLKAMEPDRVTARQIEAARRALTRHMKRAGRVWIRVFPDVPVSKKPAEGRMGSGKGTPELWVARVKPGRVIFEIDGVAVQTRSEEHTSELQSPCNLVCRLLLEKKKSTTHSCCASAGSLHDTPHVIPTSLSSRRRPLQAYSSPCLRIVTALRSSAAAVPGSTMLS